MRSKSKENLRLRSKSGSQFNSTPPKVYLNTKEPSSEDLNTQVRKDESFIDIYPKGLMTEASNYMNPVAFMPPNLLNYKVMMSKVNNISMPARSQS